MHGMNIAGKGAHPQEAIDLIVQLLLDLRRHDFKVEIAVLAPLKKKVTKFSVLTTVEHRGTHVHTSTAKHRTG